MPHRRINVVRKRGAGVNEPMTNMLWHRQGAAQSVFRAHATPCAIAFKDLHKNSSAGASGCPSALSPEQVVGLARQIHRARRIVVVGVDLDAASLASAHGVPTFAVTDSGSGPLGTICDGYLAVSIQSPSIAGSYVAPMAALNAIVVACSHLSPRRSLKHCGTPSKTTCRAPDGFRTSRRRMSQPPEAPGDATKSAARLTRDACERDQGLVVLEICQPRPSFTFFTPHGDREESRRAVA